MRSPQRKRLQKSFTGESRTRQSFNAETNINNIMSRFEKTGIIEHLNQHNGTYGDFSTVSDYHSALNQVIEAQDSFNSLPSKIRAKFNNDPGKFLDFMTNPDNLEELQQMGLIPKNNASEQVEADMGESTSEAGKSVQDDAAASEEK